MAFSAFTIILTDRCNFRCSYCYQRQTNRRLDFGTIAKALDFIFPRLNRECFVNFYGGEPLLDFDLIRKSVAYLEGLNRPRKLDMNFGLTTNGSLLDQAVLRFLNQSAFFLALSFDGWAQDDSRKKGTFDRLASLIPDILKHKRISLETISVFTPDTIHHLSASIRLLHRLSVPKIHIRFSLRRRWTRAALRGWQEEMAAVRAHFLGTYARLKDIPWSELSTARPLGIYRCDAGREQLALAPDGKLWGCFLFPHYFDGNGRGGEGKKFCFGRLEEFLRDPEANYARASVEIARLGMMRARTPERSCRMCDQIESCWVCPVAAAFSSGRIGAISSQTCRLTRLIREEKDRLSKAFAGKTKRPASRLSAPGLS